MKTSELTGAALDWAVAIVKDMRIEVRPKSACGRPLYVLAAEQGREPWLWYPSTNWAQGGPIIEREKIGLFFDRACGNRWRANHITAPYQIAKTPLVAAMRCYVASKLGDDVEIPKELVGALPPGLAMKVLYQRS
jgi:hypothetical protein